MSKPFELPEEMTIYSAVETRDKLLAWVSEQSVKNSDVLVVSAAKVAEIDGAGLQLLAALVNMDHPWKILQPSAVFSYACDAMGLTQWLMPSAHPS
jgi:hypothetical protein